MLLTIYKKCVIISSARMETYIAKRAMTNEQHLKQKCYFFVRELKNNHFLNRKRRKG